MTGHRDVPVGPGGMVPVVVKAVEYAPGNLVFLFCDIAEQSLFDTRSYTSTVTQSFAGGQSVHAAPLPTTSKGGKLSS